MFLSNRRIREPWRWPLPSVTLEPGQHLLIWCDDNTEAGPLHANFTLAGGEDEVYLFIQDDEISGCLMRLTGPTPSVISVTAV